MLKIYPPRRICRLLMEPLVEKMKTRIQHRLRLTCGWLALVLPAAPGLQASEFQTTVSLTSNYFWRGYSKSDDRWSGQFNLDYSGITGDSGFFLGSWVSSIDFGDGAGDSNSDAEAILYGGWSQLLVEDVFFDLQLSHYLFNDDLFGGNAAYSELYAFLHYRDLVTAEVSYAPDAYGLGSSTTNSQVTARYPVHAYVDLSAGLGYFAASEAFGYDYTYWNTGVTLRAGRLSVDIRHFGAREGNDDGNRAPYSSYSRYRAPALPFNGSTTVVTLTAGF